MRKLFKNAAADIPASVVVFLVALPLCLGIALGSGAPLFSGIIAGMVGGIVIGLLSGSSLSISGPAAGLTAIVAIAIGKMPAYEAFLLSVVIAGVLQVILGFLRAGIIGDYIPNSVIRGMLASIGLVLILKQFPHLIGYENDYNGDETFIQIDSSNTFSELINSVNDITPFALVIGIISILILIIWDRPVLKKKKFFKNLPGSLGCSGRRNSHKYIFFSIPEPDSSLNTSQLVNLPIATDFASFTQLFHVS